MAELAQAYVHLKPYRASEKKIRALGQYAERVAERAAADSYGGGVVIEIELEEGSVILRATVLGFALTTYGVVADYKGFKESIVELCDDARDFAVDVCNPFVKRAGVPLDDVYRFERRLKLPGKLYRVTKRIETLEKAVGELSPRQIERELSRIRSQLDAATVDLSPEERGMIESRIRPKSLPPVRQWPELSEPMKVALRPTIDRLLIEGPANDESEPRRKIVFRSQKEVPATRKRRKRQAQRSLLPP